MYDYSKISSKQTKLIVQVILSWYFTVSHQQSEPSFAATIFQTVSTMRINTEFASWFCKWKSIMPTENG